MNIYNNSEIDRAIRDVFNKYPELEYNKEIHYSLYADVVSSTVNKNIKSYYSYTKSVVENTLKPMVIELIKSNHNE